MPKFNITLPATITLFTGDNHKVAVIDTAKFSAEFIGEAFAHSIRIAAMNTYNGGGKDSPAHEKQARLDKRLASWYAGSWAIAERGEGIFTAYRDEVFIPLCLESGMTIKQAEGLIRDKVKEYFPPDTKATFANFIEATAIESESQFDGDRAASRAAVEAYYDEQLQTRRAARDKAEAKVKMPTLDLAKFKK
jgi:hypothetical protein